MTAPATRADCAGEEIHIGARIFAVADTFDAITSNRPYRKANSMEAARKEILRCAGTQFDPPSSTSSWPRQTPSGKTCAKASCVTVLPFPRSDTPSAISLKGIS